MSTQHTPGPWQMNTCHQGHFVTAPSPNGGMHQITIAETRAVTRGALYSHMEYADARLIAAAPDLLLALKELLEGSNDTTRELARSAIAKAEGR